MKRASEACTPRHLFLHMQGLGLGLCLTAGQGDKNSIEAFKGL